MSEYNKIQYNLNKRRRPSKGGSKLEVRDDLVKVVVISTRLSPQLWLQKQIQKE